MPEFIIYTASISILTSKELLKRLQSEKNLVFGKIIRQLFQIVRVLLIRRLRRKLQQKKFLIQRRIAVNRHLHLLMCGFHAQEVNIILDLRAVI